MEFETFRTVSLLSLSIVHDKKKIILRGDNITSHMHIYKSKHVLCSNHATIMSRDYREIIHSWRIELKTFNSSRCEHL